MHSRNSIANYFAGAARTCKEYRQLGHLCYSHIEIFSRQPPSYLAVPHLKDMLLRICAYFQMQEVGCLLMLARLGTPPHWQVSCSPFNLEDKSSIILGAQHDGSGRVNYFVYLLMIGYATMTHLDEDSHYFGADLAASYEWFAQVLEMWRLNVNDDEVFSKVSLRDLHAIYRRIIPQSYQPPVDKNIEVKWILRNINGKRQTRRQLDSKVQFRLKKEQELREKKQKRKQELRVIQPELPGEDLSSESLGSLPHPQQIVETQRQRLCPVKAPSIIFYKDLPVNDEASPQLISSGTIYGSRLQSNLSELDSRLRSGIFEPTILQMPPPALVYRSSSEVQQEKQVRLELMKLTQTSQIRGRNVFLSRLN